LVHPLSWRCHVVVTNSSSPTEPPLARLEPAFSRRWLALTILLGQVTLAFSMFATVVAPPKIMSAMNAAVTGIHVMEGARSIEIGQRSARG
jgi:hypothetical protein